ncbi:MAG TPA: hypothetical protein VL501_05600 [Pyrinomonadaceae bacterium]|jgi:hypothetical protein|nr:hypothetical protein [Pyrinomonadaceae bacterium]
MPDFDPHSEWDLDEELTDDLAEFDEFDDAYDVIATRTAVMAKNDMIALLCLKTAPAGAAICRVDPREERPAVQIYDDATAALEWFTKSLRTSRRNGWNVIYDGLPLQG